MNKTINPKNQTTTLKPNLNIKNKIKKKIKSKTKKHFPIPAPTYIPTLEKSSIISDEELDFQVRNG
ncbi:hypothetical protein HpNP41_14760 [Helicobacter pylori]